MKSSKSSNFPLQNFPEKDGKKGSHLKSGLAPNTSVLDTDLVMLTPLSVLRYICYYSGTHSDGHHSIGAAVSASPWGPYTDLGHPLVHYSWVGLYLCL